LLAYLDLKDSNNFPDPNDRGHGAGHARWRAGTGGVAQRGQDGRRAAVPLAPHAVASFGDPTGAVNPVEPPLYTSGCGGLVYPRQQPWHTDRDRGGDRAARGLRAGRDARVRRRVRPSLSLSLSPNLSPILSLSLSPSLTLPGWASCSGGSRRRKSSGAAS
jgi:hypothetical protein